MERQKGSQYTRHKGIMADYVTYAEIEELYFTKFNKTLHVKIKNAF